jgi:hypothetical protein
VFVIPSTKLVDGSGPGCKQRLEQVSASKSVARDNTSAQLKVINRTARSLAIPVADRTSASHMSRTK